MADRKSNNPPVEPRPLYDITGVEVAAALDQLDSSASLLPDLARIVGGYAEHRHRRLYSLVTKHGLVLEYGRRLTRSVPFRPLPVLIGCRSRVRRVVRAGTFR